MSGKSVKSYFSSHSAENLFFAYMEMLFPLEVLREMNFLLTFSKRLFFEWIIIVTKQLTMKFICHRERVESKISISYKVHFDFEEAHADESF